MQEKKIDRRISALRLRLRDIDKDLQAIKASDRDNYFSDASIFSVFLFLSFVIAVFSFAVIWSTRYHMTWDQFYDLLAYALPSFAAIAAGIGIYFRRFTTLLFVISGVCVIGGFVSYMWTKHAYLCNKQDCHAGFYSTLWMAGGLVVAISAVTLFVIRCKRSELPWKRLSQAGKVRRLLYLAFCLAGLLIAVFCVMHAFP